MLIRLNKPSSESGGGVVKPLPLDSVTVACPDHLVLADLPVAKGIGAATVATVVKTVGRRSRRQLGERVHFCVRCDFPIAIYGRLSPCEHAFCLDCARSDSICYLCDERIQKIQTIKMMEGILICAAPHCLKSFLKRAEFEAHIHENHSDLLQPNSEKDNGIESEVQSAKQHSTSDSNFRGPARPVISGSNSQFPDSEDKARRQQPREQSLSRPMMQPRPPFFGQAQNYPSEPQPDNNRPPSFDRPGMQNHFQQSMPGGTQQEPNQFPDKQQGILSEAPMPEYPPMHSIPPPNFIVPMNSNPLMTPQYGVPPFQPEGGQPFFGAPYDMGQMARQDSNPEIGMEQGSLLGFPPGPGGMNFMANYPQPWNAGPAAGVPDAFPNHPDSRGNAAFYQGEYGRNPGGMPSVNKGMEGGNAMDSKDGKGILAPQPYRHAQPPPPLQQPKRGKYYSGDAGQDGQGFGWQHENRDGFGSGQE